MNRARLPAKMCKLSTAFAGTLGGETPGCNSAKGGRGGCLNVQDHYYEKAPRKRVQHPAFKSPRKGGSTY